MDDDNAGPGAEPTFTRASPEGLPLLSKELCARIPAEVWRMIAAFTIDRYELQLTEVLRTRNAVHLNANNPRDVINMQTVSKAFESGVKLGVRDMFSGRVSFTDGCPAIPVFITTSLASRVRSLNFNRYTFPEAIASDQPHRDLNNAILSHQLPNLSKMTFSCADLSGLWDVEACLKGSYNEDVVNEAEDLKSELVELGLSGIDNFRSCVVLGILWMSKVGTVFAFVNLVGTTKMMKKPRIARNPVAIIHLPNTMSCRQFIRLNPSTD